MRRSLLHTLRPRAPDSKSRFGRRSARPGIHQRRFFVERLEDRCLLSLGDLLYTLDDPSMNLTQAGCRFGFAVAADANLTVVGAPYVDAAGQDVGRAYVYNSTTGARVATLENPTPAEMDMFGYSVGLSGTTAVVGAIQDGTGAWAAGSAYIFDAVTGTLLRTVNNPTPTDGDGFGWSVAISGSTVIVGAGWDDTGATDAGSAYVYDASTGNLLWTLNNPAPASNDLFGCSAAVSGSTVVVGAYFDDAGATDSGSAYVFDAATGSLLHTLDNPTPAASDYFGCSVAVSVSTVVVGASQDDTVGSSAGSAYIFDAATGNLLRTLVSPTPRPVAYFGLSVAVSGSTVVVGAPQDGTGVYVFDAAAGNLVRTLNDPTPGHWDRFGYSVAVSGSTVAVGGYQDDFFSTDAGSAYVYDAATGGLVHTLNPTLPASQDLFGWSVAVSGRTLIVGAYWDDTGAMDAGLVYVYDASTGSLLRTVSNPAPAAGDGFGYSVAVSGNTVVVGAPYDDAGATDAGSAYVFDVSTGDLLWTLNNPTPASIDYFGRSVAISGSTVVVGAYWDDTGAAKAGSAYIYDAATGDLMWTLNDPTPGTEDYFGCSVAVSGNSVVVGAYYDDVGGTRAGSAYVFDAATGALLRTLTDPSPSVGWFGASVAVSGSIVVVGAPYDRTGSMDAGSVFVFNAATGGLLQTLHSPTSARTGWFGWSVALWGSTVLVGAPLDETGASPWGAGAAYIFDAATGSLLRTLHKATPERYDQFGYSVAISESTAVVGVPRENGITADRGAAYVFDAAKPTTLEGTSGDDAFAFSTDGTFHYVTVTLAGGSPTRYSYPASEPVTLTFDGVGGNDSVTLTGGSGDETAEFYPDHGTLAGSTYSVSVSNVESIIANSGGGNDQVTLHDGSQPDTFIGYPAYAILTGPGVWLKASNFRSVIAAGTPGGQDVARLSDSSGDDTFTAYPTFAVLTDGSTFSNRANDFRYVFATAAQDGTDTAMFYDSPGSDTFTSSPTAASMSGRYRPAGAPGDRSYYNSAQDFDTYTGTSTAGSDLAKMRDSAAGNELFTATPTQATLSGIGVFAQANNFRYVNAFATGGSDVAKLEDSAGTDSFVGNPGYGVLFAYASPVNPFYVNRATGFDRIEVTSQNGGSDIARFYDSLGNDNFTAYEKAWAELKNDAGNPTSFDNKVNNFRYVYAFASEGTDIAYLYGSSGNDTFEGRPHYAYLINSARGFYNRANAFDQVFAYGNGGDDSATLRDSALADEFYGSGNIARLYDAAMLAYFYEAQGFDRVNVYGTAGGTNTRTIARPIDYALTFYGTWTGDPWP